MYFLALKYFITIFVFYFKRCNADFQQLLIFADYNKWKAFKTKTLPLSWIFWLKVFLFPPPFSILFLLNRTSFSSSKIKTSSLKSIKFPTSANITLDFKNNFNRRLWIHPSQKTHPILFLRNQPPAIYLQSRVDLILGSLLSSESFTGELFFFILLNSCIAFGVSFICSVWFCLYTLVMLNFLKITTAIGFRLLVATECGHWHYSPEHLDIRFTTEFKSLKPAPFMLNFHKKRQFVLCFNTVINILLFQTGLMYARYVLISIQLLPLFLNSCWFLTDVSSNPQIPAATRKWQHRKNYYLGICFPLFLVFFRFLL